MATGEDQENEEKKRKRRKKMKIADQGYELDERVLAH